MLSRPSEPPERPGSEPALLADLPIIDAHHHLWLLPGSMLDLLEAQEAKAFRALMPMYRRRACYLLDDYLADADSGHKILASVYVDAHTMYRTTGPAEMRSVGEVEFANGVAAMSASGLFGAPRLCSAIVSNVDLTLGDRVDDILAAHQRGGGGRLRGVRASVMHHSDPAILGIGNLPPGLLERAEFRSGAARLPSFGMSLDVLLLGPQLPELIALAKALPDLQIILNHMGSPSGTAGASRDAVAQFDRWQRDIRELATLENVSLKLSGFGLPFADLAYAATPPSSTDIARAWRPYFETCLDAFGPARCMFGSNFPVDDQLCPFPVLWNAFKRLAGDLAENERDALFCETARRIYGIEIADGAIA